MVKSKVKADPGTKRAERAKKAKEGQDRKKAYLEVKRRALNYEKENYTQLVAIKSKDGDWWKLVGHSAVIYKYMVAPRLRLKPKLMPDSDYDEISKEGVISISDIEQFEKNLKMGKIYLVNSSAWTKVFDLGERVSEEDYQLMLHEDEMRLEMANKLIMPKERLSELNNKVKTLLNLMHSNVRKMEGVARDSFGIEMDKRVVKIRIMVLRAARGTVDIEDCLTEAFDATEDLYGYIMALMDLKLLSPKVIYDMTEAVVALESQIKKEINKRAMELADTGLQERVRKRNKIKEGHGNSSQPEAGEETKRVDVLSGEEGTADGSDRGEKAQEPDEKPAKAPEKHAKKTAKK